jgi:hypothetical protein
VTNLDQVPHRCNPPDLGDSTDVRTHRSLLQTPGTMDWGHLPRLLSPAEIMNKAGPLDTN